MKYKSLFIANLAEIAIPLTKNMSSEDAKKEIWEDHVLCDRFLLLKDDNRVIVTPFAIDPYFFKDTCQILKFKNILNVFLDQCNESICESILKEEKTLNKLIEIIKENPGIKIYSYAGTQEFIKFIKFLKLKGLSFVTPEIPEEKYRWTQSFFGSKAGFRQAAANLGPKFPPMPEGAICTTNEELNGWANHFADTGYVVKQNQGLAGAGLTKIKNSEVNQKEWKEDNFPIVIERLIDADINVCGGDPNIELVATNQGVKILYTCAMRVTKAGVFRGIEIGKGAVPKVVDKVLRHAGSLWGKYLTEKGYRGYFEIDAVAGKNGSIYPIEANLRRTGGTHVFETTERLLGDGWSKSYIVARNIADTKFNNYLSLKKATEKFYFKNGEGVIITMANYLGSNKFGYIVIGKNKKSALEIENKFYESCI